MSDEKSAHELLGLKLTKRETEVLELLCETHPNSTIAKNLCVQIGTVKAHLSRIYRKLGVKSRVQAILKTKSENADAQ